MKTLMQWMRFLYGLISPETGSERIAETNSIPEEFPTLFPSQYGSGFFDLEFLYMAPDEDGLTYAWTFPEEFPSGAGQYSRGGPLPNGTSRELNMDWSPGLRFAAGYRFPRNSWELSLSWTSYFNHSKASASIPSFSNSTLIATWFPSGFFAAEYVALNASADWNLNYNTLDLILARGAFATKNIAITPLVAFRGAFIHQHYNVSYSDGNFLNEVGTPIPDVKMSLTNNFDGWGLKGGVNTQWFLTRNWSLYANGGASLLYGRFHIKEKAKMTSAPYRDFITAQDSYFQNVFEIDARIGTKWEMFFQDGKRHMAFSVGYEMMSWLEQNQLFNYYFVDRAPGAGQPSQGDLGIQGINISAHFDY